MQAPSNFCANYFQGKWLPMSMLIQFTGFADFCKLKKCSPSSERSRFESADELAENFKVAVNLAGTLLTMPLQRRLTMFRIDLAGLMGQIL